MANTSSQRLLINLGSQSNDGTGDAIRDAFNKVNLNFETIFNVAGLGSGLQFTKLSDAPRALRANKAIITDGTGLTLTQMTLVGANGIQVTVDQTLKQVSIDATITNLVNDPSPALSANMSGSGAYRGINFANPVDDQDLVTKKWIHDNFLNRDSNYEYISSTNPVTHTNNTTTVVEGSTLRHNIQIQPSAVNTAHNVGQVISLYDANGNLTDLDLSVGAWRPSHATRKDYVDSKISLQGIDTVDPETGVVNPGFGQMTGPLYLSRDPIETDPGNVAATKNYVDSTGFPSKSNFFVALNGNDANYAIPPYKRGRSWAWAFRTVQRAAQAALQYSKASEIKLGVYQREITTNNYTELVTISRIDPSSISVDADHARLNIQYYGGAGGSDPFLERSIRPGMYLQGVDSNAIAEILNVALTVASNSEEYYEIQYYDYAETFNSNITPDALSGTVTFTFFSPNIIEVPDFWVGYKFLIDNGPSGTIQSVGLYYAPNGNVYDTVTVLIEQGALTNLNIISGPSWHVYSGFFIQGESLRYGQKYNKLEISLMVESGEYGEQLPIRIGDNISVKGDEFRRTVIKPAYALGTARTSISTSEWADVYFRRDTQIDGIIAVQLDMNTDYALSTTITPSSQTNDSTTGVITFTLTAGSASSTWVGKVLVLDDPKQSKGVIKSVSGNTFSVDIAENIDGNRQISVGAGVPITSGTWHLYTPINFGYHYLRDTSKPVNYIADNTQPGGYRHAAALIKDNRQFLQQEVLAFVNHTYGGSLIYNQDLCYRDVGFLVDALVYDLENGNVWGSINAADSYYKANVTAVTTSELVATLGAIGWLNATIQTILSGGTVVKSVGNTGTQVTSTLAIESPAATTVADLTGAMVAILGGSPDFNPPKYNDEMDIFLMNDATMLRYLGGNGHGGFMKVLDPEGQIKSKSPYTQTCSSFAQSSGKHEFRGGFFVDGFAGNLLSTVDHSQLTAVGGKYYALNDGNANHLVRIPVSGLIRKPVFPTFFIDNGIQYEVDYIESFNSANGTGILHLNPNNPGGIESVSINSGNTAGEFKTNVASLPVTFSNPGTAGSLTTRGYATTDGSGNISSITITFTGKGYSAQPIISLGGATFNFVVSAGVIVSMAVNSGGSGYTTNTTVNIASPGGSGTKATASIISVDSNGSITGINLTYGGSGYSASATPAVTFGRQIFSAAIKIGFVGALPTKIELNAPGNRSMLANDFTQLNDLGYGIFCTNGGFIENVSMFTYYCYTSYYALNGAQVRTITGSSAYGKYGLVSEGSNPNEVPTPVVIPDELVQIATVYNQNAYTNKATGSDLYVTLDSTYGYAPYPESEVEVNHNGVRKTYAVNNAVQISGSLYDLSLGTSGGGLYAQVADGAQVTIRIKNQWRLYGLNANSITRPSTVLTLSEDPTYNYRVLSYTDKGSDYALTETDQAYNYIQVNPYSVSNLYRQGIGRPSISSAGTGYTNPSYPVTFVGPTTKTAVINGNQGTAQAPVTQITVGSASGPIHVGMAITGGGALANQYVTYVSLDRTVIQTSIAQYWTASNTITLLGTTATAVAYSNVGGGIASVTITDPGVGYDTAPVGSVAGGGNNATINTSLSGNSGTNVVKILPLNSVAAARVTAGLTASTPYYYIFGYEGVRYAITNYLPPATTGQAWGEIEVSGYNNAGGAIATLTREMMLDPLYAGVSKNTPGNVTIQISTLRATSHDMVDIGTGGYATSKIPNDLYGPPTIAKNQSQETKELNKGRVYYVTTDQDGNFRVGKYFAVDQGRGTVTISAPISLTGINKLSFKKGTTVDEFSIDDTMASNSTSKVPVESAVVGYLDHRLGIDRNGAKAAGFIGPGVMALNGINAMTGALSMGSNKITTMAVPTNSSDAATKGYTDAKISLQGQSEVTNNGGQNAGMISGPLHLVHDPITATAVTAGIVNPGATVISLASVVGLYLGMQLNTSTAVGSVITNIDTNANAITISPATTGAMVNGATITFDHVQEPATKRYVDKVQFNTLRDVALTSTADTDLVMLGNALTANSGTTTPLYSSTRQVVNVANNVATILNTPTASAGGSDVTLSRSGNSLTIKLVGGAGNANPITNYHINNSAAIDQSKLNLQAAVTSISAPGSFTQSSLGLAVFNNKVFTATNGWIDLADSTGTTNGIDPSKMKQIAAGGGLLGSSNLAATAAATYLSSSTVRTWLGVIDSAAGGTFTGNLNVNNIYPNTNNTYSIGTNANRFANIYGTNVYDSGNRVVTSVTPSAGDYVGVSYSASGPGATLTYTNLGVRTVAGTANQVFVGAGSATAAVTGTITLSLPQNIDTGANVTFNQATLGTLAAAGGGGTVTGSWTLGSGASFQATYADLAEWYASDAEYEPGTVLIFGGKAEVTTTAVSSDSRVAGVVTTDPAYVMNSGLEGVRACIALQGRVPVKVIGTVRKGDMLTTSNTAGYAQKAMNPTVGTIIGKALATKDNPDAGWVEVAIGRM